MIIIKPKTIIHIFIMIICTLFAWDDVQAQCSGGTQFSETQIPCSGIDQSVNSVPRLQFIKVNVINGINCTFTSSISGITLVNDSNGALVDNTSGTSIDYTSTFSGIIRIYNCHALDVVANLSFIANNTGSNIQDSQSSCGSNNWVGHMYKRLDNSIITPPSDADAFTSYVGYFNKSEIFSEGFGGDFNCLPILSGGSNVINLFTEFFAAKFCNQSVKPKGAYVLSSITANDGIRFYVAGTLVFNRWLNQSATYNNVLFQHSGNSKLELHYYETDTANVLNVGAMTRVNNVLTNNLNQSVCANIPPAQFIGTNVLTTAPISGASGYVVTYQWQVSTDSIIFSNVLGATSQNYTPTQTGPNTYYFRRIATVSNTNPGSIPITAVDESNVAQLVVHHIPCGTISGEVICEGAPEAHLTFYNPAVDTGPFTLVINGVTYNNVLSGMEFNVIVPLVTTIYNLTQISDINGCVNL